MRKVRATLTANARNSHRLAEHQTRLELPPRTLQHLESSIKKQWKRYRRGLKRCQAKFSEGAVHESRVETRRLLSLLELLAPFLSPRGLVKAQAALKAHLDTFDELRDTQVQLPTVKKMRLAFAAARSFHEYLQKREGRLTRLTRKRIKCVRSKRLGKLVAAGRAELKKWRALGLHQQVNERLLGAVQRAFSRTVQLRQRATPNNTATIHRTRVAFKKFRYMIETLSDHLGSVDKQLLRRLHQYQTLMGEIQDAEMLLKGFEKFQRKQSVEPAAAARLRREWIRHRERLIRSYFAAADQLFEFWPPCAAATRTRLAFSTHPISAQPSQPHALRVTPPASCPAPPA